MAMDMPDQIKDESISTGKQNQTPEQRAVYLESLAQDSIRQPESQPAESQEDQEERIMGTVEKTGLPEKAVRAAYDLFTSKESPFDMVGEEVEDLLIKVSKTEGGQKKLYELFNAANDYYKNLGGDLQIALGANVSMLNGSVNEIVDTRAYDENDFEIPPTVRNNIYHPSQTVQEIMNRVHRDGVNYSGLTESPQDRHLRTQLEKIEKTTPFYRIQELKDALLAASDPETDIMQIPSMYREAARRHREMKRASQELIMATSSWGE